MMSATRNHVSAHLRQHGFAIVPEALESACVDRVISLIDVARSGGSSASGQLRCSQRSV